MTEYVWSELREQCTADFLSAPSAALEDRILAVFEQNPRHVVNGIRHVADRFQRGLVRSPWVVLAKHVEEAAGGRDLRVDDTTERNLAVSRAEAWIRSTGLHFDRPDEIEDELFGDRGRLKAWAGDRDLVRRLIALWLEQRPRGLQVEQEAEERGRQQLEARARVAAEVKRRRELAQVPPEAVEALGL